MNIDKKLNEILDDFKILEHWVEDGVQKHNQIQPNKAKQEIKQLFQELIDEVIGNDLETETYEHKLYETIIVNNTNTNKLRAEQRQRAKELLEKL